MIANSRRALALSLLLLAACKIAACKPAGAPAGPAEVQLATDLPRPVVDTILQLAERSGAPRTEQIAGLSLGSSVLAAPEVVRVAASQTDGGPAPAELPLAAAPATQGTSGDLRWDLEPYGAILAAARGELAPIPSSAQDVPGLWRDPAGTWVAVGGRAEVLLVGIEALGDHGAPVRFTALTESWLKGKVAVVAPTGGASLAHFAALYEAWGTERMEAWLAGLKANEVQLLDSDDAVRNAVVTGAATVGILSSDEAAKAAASAAKVLVVYPNQRSIGVFVWPTALSRPKSSPHADAAATLAERLGDRATEQLLVARLPGFLPLRANIPVPPGVSSAANLVVISVDPARIVEEIARRRSDLADWAAGAKQK